MFQFCFGVAKEQENWFRTIEEVFAIRVKKAGGLYAAVTDAHRTVVSVACETPNKLALMREIRECFTDMFATVVKYDYLSRTVKLPINKRSRNLLLHTLVAFDRENERECIKNALLLCNGMSLDGIFYFRMRELRSRWAEIARLATENAAYLIDEDTLNELIRFLISAVNPKIVRLDVRQSDGKYNIRGRLSESDFEYDIVGQEQLLLYLIDIAPLELRLHGTFTDERLCDRLTRIFDAKRSDGKEIRR